MFNPLVVATGLCALAGCVAGFYSGFPVQRGLCSNVQDTCTAVLNVAGGVQQRAHRRPANVLPAVTEQLWWRKARCGGSRATTGRLRMAADLYGVLGVPDDADRKTIKRAYRRAAMKSHPDVNDAPDAREKFMEVVRAYEVLSDDKKRQEYDRKRRFGGFNSTRGRASSSSSRHSSGGADRRRSQGTRTSRDEAWRKWQAYNPTPDQIDDSFGQIFSDLLSGLGKEGPRGVVEDFLSFLEMQAEGFSDDSSPELEELLESSDADALRAEADNARLLLDKLVEKARQLRTQRLAAEKEVLAAQSGRKDVRDLAELDRQMDLIDRAAGLKARCEEIDGHITRTERRVKRLDKKIQQLGARPSGSGTTSAGRRGERGPADSGGRPSAARTGPARQAAQGWSPPKPPGQRKSSRVDDPSIDEELLRLKRKMGL